VWGPALALSQELDGLLLVLAWKLLLVLSLVAAWELLLVLADWVCWNSQSHPGLPWHRRWLGKHFVHMHASMLLCHTHTKRTWRSDSQVHGNQARRLIFAPAQSLYTLAL